MLSWHSSFAVRLGDGLSGGLLVDHRAAVREGGDEGLARQVVHGPGKASGGLVDAADGVVGEEWVAASGEAEVVGDLARALLGAHRRDRVAQRDALVERREGAETQA